MEAFPLHAPPLAPEAATRPQLALVELDGGVLGVLRTPTRYEQTLKPVIDRVAAGALLAVLLPILLMATVAIRVGLGPGALFRQRRVGLGGKLFTVYKFRTMLHSHELQGRTHDDCALCAGTSHKCPGDPRHTPVGRVLRKLSIDELPQLLNVLRGEMSLIGPRPERPEFVPDLERQLPAYRQRLQVRPGVTGLAQVQLPPDSDVDSVRRKLACDLWYVQNVSPWLDLRLLLGTVGYALGVPFRLTGRLLGLPGVAAVEPALSDWLEPAAARPRRSA